MGQVIKEVKPKTKWFKTIYVKILLWFVGRAIQATSKIDKNVKEELKVVETNTIISMKILPNGDKISLIKTNKGYLKFLGFKCKEVSNLTVLFRNIDDAFLVFSFQESTVDALANIRFIADGPLGLATLFVRMLNLVEIYLLPKFIAKLAVRRYESPKHKHLNRFAIYVRTILGV